MKLKKSHFLYDKHQKNGAFLLVLLIIIVQLLYVFVDFPETSLPTSNLVNQLESRLDSLKKVEKNNTKPKKYFFNPNFITDFRGYQLGMSVEEIDRLHEFRKLDKYVNSAKEFQVVTKVSDSLLAEIAPYFKFPDWVNQKAKNQNIKKLISNEEPVAIRIDSKKLDLNSVTFNELINQTTIDRKIAGRILNYRNKLKGFTYETQLSEVWGINNEEVKTVLERFKIYEKPQIKKININTASFKEVLHLPYIDYDLCKKIFDYKEEVAEIQNIEELKNITDFPLKKYDRIILYLEAK